jgi:hypothetical protein
MLYLPQEGQFGNPRSEIFGGYSFVVIEVDVWHSARRRDQTERSFLSDRERTDQAGKSRTATRYSRPFVDRQQDQQRHSNTRPQCPLQPPLRPRKSSAKPRGRLLTSFTRLRPCWYATRDVVARRDTYRVQNTHLDRQQLSYCVSLIENGANPEALAVSLFHAEISCSAAVPINAYCASECHTTAARRIRPRIC